MPNIPWTPERIKQAHALALEHGNAEAARRVGCTTDQLYHALKRRGLQGKAVAPGPTSKLPEVPLTAERVTAEHAKIAAQRRLHAERDVLLAENHRLRKELDAARSISTPSQITIYSKAPAEIGDAVACALASDWHVEESVEASSVHGLNEYNLDIAEERAKLFFQNLLRLVEIHARDSTIKRICLQLIGDFITNYIHDELKETNNLPPTYAANFALEQLIKGIDFLLKESSFEIDSDLIPGNHGRMTLKPRIQNATGTSLETFMYHALARHYEGQPRVHMRVADSKMAYRKYFESFVMRTIHGDDIKFGGGVGGITIPIRKKLAAWDKAQPATLTVMGHFHQRIDGGDFMVNGSLIGYNEFAQAIGASPEPPQQSFFLIHARHGGQKTVVAPIWVTPK